MAILTAYFGKWGGQIISAPEKGDNSIMLIGTLFLCFAVYYVIFNKKLNIRIPEKKILVLLLAVQFLLIFFRTNQIESLRNFVSIFGTYFISVFLAVLLHQINIQKAIKYFAFSLTVILTISVFVHITFVGNFMLFSHDSFNRTGGLFFFGEFGVMSGLNAVFYLLLFNTIKNESKLIYLSFFLLMVLYVFSSDLRNGIFAILISIIFIYFINSIKSWKSFILFVTISLIVLLIYSYYSANSKGGEKDVTDDFNYRTIIWDASLIAIKKAPLVGFGNLENYFNNEPITNILKINDPHSSILALTIQSGLIVLIIFLIYYSKISFNVFKNKYKEYLIIPLFWFISTLTGGAFFNGTFQFPKIIFIVSMLGVLGHPTLLKKEIFK